MTTKAAKQAVIEGTRYGKWLVVRSEGPAHVTPNGKKHRTALCLCDCGKLGNPTISGLIRGRSKSCNSPKCTGLSKGRFRKQALATWHRIQRRCANDRTYFSKNITVCDEWVESFNRFLGWCEGTKMPEGMQLDRIDNTKGYSPDNCRWCSARENTENRSTSVIWTVNGKDYSSARRAAEALNVPRHTIVKWCRGTKTKPPKESCSARPRYV